MSSKINLQTCEYACKSSIFQDNQLISIKYAIPRGILSIYLLTECVESAIMSLLLDESNTSLNQILRMSLTHSSANLMHDGRSCMTRSLGKTHPRKLRNPPCFLPVSLERAPARHGRCRTGAFHVKKRPQR